MAVVGIGQSTSYLNTVRKSSPGFAATEKDGRISTFIPDGGPEMAHDKRFVAWKRHHRRRKAAKAKMKLYEQGKLSFEKLPMLAKSFLRRKKRGQTATAA
jgi:hypothetical protein